MSRNSDKAVIQMEGLQLNAIAFYSSFMRHALGGLDSTENYNLARMVSLQSQNPRRKLDGARGGAFR